MTTTHEPFPFYIGDTWQIDFICTDDDAKPLDLTGATLTWKLARWSDDGETTQPPAFTLTIGDGITVDADPATGKVEVSLSAARSATLTPGYFEDQLRVTTAAGIVSTQAMGRIDARATI